MTSPQEIIARALVPILSGGQEDDLGRDLPDKQFDDLTPEWQERFGEYANAVEASLTHSGMAIVPVEPTEAMLFAAKHAVGDPLTRHWFAMIQASQEVRND